MCIVPLDATSTAVATAVRGTSRSTPSGGQVDTLARSVNQATKRPLKNISSDASQTMTPTPSGVGPRSGGAVSVVEVTAVTTLLWGLRPQTPSPSGELALARPELLARCARSQPRL